LVPRQLPLSPVIGLAIRVELANLVTVQGLHDADPRQHCRAAFRRDQDQGLRRRLPFRRFVLRFRKLRDVGAGISPLTRSAIFYWASLAKSSN
jgi:hypothetical protein